MVRHRGWTRPRETTLPQAHFYAGAYRMAWVDWTRHGDDGWDCDWSFDGLDATLYPTKEACEQAIQQQHKAAA